MRACVCFHGACTPCWWHVLKTACGRTEREAGSVWGACARCSVRQRRQQPCRDADGCRTTALKAGGAAMIPLLSLMMKRHRRHGHVTFQQQLSPSLINAVMSSLNMIRKLSAIDPLWDFYGNRPERWFPKPVHVGWSSNMRMHATCRCSYQRDPSQRVKNWEQPFSRAANTTLDIQTKTRRRLWWPQIKRQVRWAVGRGSSSHSSSNLFSHSVELFSSISCICKQSIRDKSNYWQQTQSELRSWTCVRLNFNGLLSTSSSQVCSDPWHVCGMHISAASNGFYPTVEAGLDQTKFQAVAQLLSGGMCVFILPLKKRTLYRKGVTIKTERK